MVDQAKAAIANLSNSDKASLGTGECFQGALEGFSQTAFAGLGLIGGPCVGSTDPVDIPNFKGLCLQGVPPVAL